MTERPKTAHARKSRGGMHQYFDTAVHEDIYGKREKKEQVHVSKEPIEIKKTALVRLAGGRFEIDRKVLVDECAADFRNAWFYKGATRAITHRWDTSVLKAFDPKPTELLPKMESVTSSGTETKLDLLNELNQQIVDGRRNTKLVNSKYIDESSQSPTNKSIPKIASRKPKTMEVEDLFHSAAENVQIDTFVKRKYVSMRTNVQLGVNSPDIILFKECLRMNVLPPGSLDLQKSSDLDPNLQSYDHSASTRQLALMTSTLLGKTSVGTSSVELDGGNSFISIPEHGSVGFGPTHASSAHSIGSIDSTDIIGIENEQVISINLNNRSIGNDRGICLSAALSYCPHLTVMRLSNNRLTDRGLSMILKAVFNISYCEELDISCNSVGDDTTACLAEYLQVSHCALRKLNLRRCAIDDDSCIRLCSSLHHNESLEALDLSENLALHEEFTLAHGDTPSGGAAIAEMLVRNRTLTELRVASNHLRTQCVQLLAERLTFNESLRLLDLSHNGIGDHEGRLIGRALHAHRTLTHLDLSFNSLSSKAAITIAYAAQQPDSALAYINLNENSIGKLGGVYMLRAMRVVASYPDFGHHKHARHFPLHGLDVPEDSLDNPMPRRLLAIDYKVTVLPLKDENIYDVHRPLKHYALNLADPYDYTIARMLVDLADRHPTATWKSLKYLLPGSHLWEFIHLGRGGLFELPAEFGQTSMQIWADHAAQITEAVETIQAAKIAEMQAHSSGGRDRTGRRKAFRAPVAVEEDSGTSAGERLGSVLSVTQSPSGGGDGAGGDAAKQVRHKTRHARHVLYRLGVKLGFVFEDELLVRIIDGLCTAPPDARVKLVTLLEIIYQQLFASLRGATSGRRNSIDLTQMHIPLADVARHITIFGIHKDVEVDAVMSAVDRARRLISEGDLAEDKLRLSFKWYMQLMMARQIDILPPTSRTYWAALNTTHPWAVPTAGLLHVELNYPLLPPTVHRVLSNASLLALLEQVTNFKDTERALDQIEQVLSGTANELCLTCIQAEIVLQRIAKFKRHSHFGLVESLIFQMVSPLEVRRFIVRNLYFSEILTLRRKQNYMLRVLTGNVTGHYVLDMRNEVHRNVAVRLAELNTFHQMQVLKRDVNTSQNGSGDCFRNASFNSNFIVLDSAWFNDMPEVGKLRFDYVSPLRCPEGLPPSAGTWGCSFEGYGTAENGSVGEPSPAQSVFGEGEDDVYDELAEHEGKFSSLHAKEQFVQELVENLFAKKFDPRSRTKRKETRSCPKNTDPIAKRGGPKNTGKFYQGMNAFAKAVGAANETVKVTRQTYVDKVKKIGFESSLHEDSTQQSKDHSQLSSSSSESSGDEYGLKGDAQEEPGELKHEDTFSQWNMRSKMFQKPQSPTATTTAATAASGAATSAPNSPTRQKPKKTKPVSRYKEVYLAEATEYWKDTADTCWARCRATHVDALKKKLEEVVQNEFMNRASDKDINAGIPPAAYLHKDFVALRNLAVYKSVGQYVAKRSRRPNSAMAGLPLNYSLNQTALWGGMTGSKKYSVALEKATVDEIAAAAVSLSATSTKNPFVATVEPTSTKMRRRSTAMSAKIKLDKTLDAVAATANALGGSLSIDDSGAAAVIAKLAFEKFLLRLEVVALYNTWLTVDQVRVILQALLSHSAPVSVIVRALCILFNCIVDRAQFYSLMFSCSDQLRNELVHRLGILNVWSPQYPDGKFELDLAAHDQRQAFRIMCLLVHETAHKPGRHEMAEVVYFKDSLLDQPANLSSRNANRPSSPFGKPGNASPTGTANDSYSAEDRLPNVWVPPELWSRPDPAGPPGHGHIHFVLRTVAAPAYTVL